MNRISTCLWFDDRAEEAAKFYISVFEKSKILSVVHYTESGAKMSGQKVGSIMTVDTEVMGLGIMALNGGPVFKFSPSFSYSVTFSNEKDLEEKWKRLTEGGEIRMGLDKYPWSAKYGWTQDKFGVDWQLNLVEGAPRITPSLLFTDALFGRGKEAIDFYVSLFPNSKVENLASDPKTNHVMFCDFVLDGQHLTLMEGEGEHGHKFTHANSIVVSCRDQKEIDHYSEKLSAGGSIEDCGWVVDKFGLCWQIVPEMMKSAMPNPAKAERIMRAMTGMKKLDLAKLTAAAESAG